jgi:predicted PurR-regulated permease PerM
MFTRGRKRHPVMAIGRRAAKNRKPLLDARVDPRLAVQVALLVLAVLYTLYFARELVVPIVAAVLLYQLLQRPVQALSNIGLPRPASSALVLFALVGVIAAGAHFMADPAEEWLRDAPASLGELRRELQRTAGALDELRELGEEIDELATMGESDSSVPTVQIQPPGQLQAITGALPKVIAGALLAFVTCFFLLIQGERLGHALIALGPTRLSRRRISNMIRGVGAQVSTYLTTVTMINVGLGVVVAMVMWMLDVPYPGMWGALAGVLNFAPYIGPAVNTFVLTVVGVTAFDSLGQALAVPAAYLVVTSLEGMVVTPMILGRRVRIGSLWAFLSVVFWGWMWGAPGALMAVPLTASIFVFWQAFRDVDPFRNARLAAAGSGTVP